MAEMKQAAVAHEFGAPLRIEVAWSVCSKSGGLSALEQTQGDQRVAVVNLYKALGGSWKRKDEEWRAPK